MAEDKKPEVPYVPIPTCHLEAARTWRLMERIGLIKRVPLSECEKLPDPDYGL